jgi:hypothetical protein
MCWGERFMEDGNEWIPIPPAVDIPIEMVRGVMTQDLAIMSQTIPRLFIGGVAFTRMLGMFPKLPDTFLAHLPHSLQKTYVGWDMKQPDGTVPVFAADGRIIDFRHGSEMIMRSLGADLGRWGNIGAMDNYMVNQRDEIIQARREAIRYYLAGEVAKAERIRRRFEKRHGFPLTISKQQIQEAIRLRSTPRPERVLERIPPELRPVYQQMLARSGGPRRLALPGEAITQAETARQRDVLRRAETLLLEPGAIDRLRQLAQESEALEGRRGFVGYRARESQS